ncbi:hypothetical protein [Sphingomonas sp.]|uniref:hypothetical protein n=1 Tax=Sphingomonas sp. TaxID=28214 RepID=UPI003B001BDB
MAQDGPGAAERLAAAGRAGYDANPRDCSHSIQVMLRAMGSPDEPYRTANDLMTHMQSRGSGWRKVALAEAGQLANAGKVVIGGLAVPGGHGHVVMVMPGPPRPSGGFRMNSGATLPSSGTFPASASGASSSWPGARSRGEKTVRDPWTASDWGRVTFWTRD